MWLNCSIWSQFAAHFSSFHHKRATQIQSRCLRHLFSVKWNILTLWLWVVGFMNYTIIIKCSGNSFLWRIASLRRCGGTLNGKMCCFLLMTTRNEKCVVFNVSDLCCRPLQLTDICPCSLGGLKSLATQHREQRFFIILHFNNRGKKRVLFGFSIFFLYCDDNINSKSATTKKLVKGNKKLFS